MNLKETYDLGTTVADIKIILKQMLEEFSANTLKFLT